MDIRITQPVRVMAMDLRQMEKALWAGPVHAQTVRQYHDQAVASRQMPAAADFFRHLLDRYPGSLQIRRLYISLCLQVGRYDQAMSSIETLLAYGRADDALIDSALQVREKQVFLSRCRSSARKKLSVCMIVRNEQQRLAPCLHSIKKIADEIVVVDTGSTDRTVDLARIFGTHVLHFQWRDDFAAARNAGLKAARGDWILALDADEIIADADLPGLKELIQDHRNQAVAFAMETRNYTHTANFLNWQSNKGKYPQCETGLGWFPSTKIRLFPNQPEIHFQYPVHELVDPAVEAAGLTVARCPVPIHHYGHLNEQKNREKAIGYFKIGYAKLHQIGSNVAALRELAVQAGQLAFWTEALDLWQRLLKIRPDFIEAHVNMAGALWQLGHYPEAHCAAISALKLNPAMKEAGYNYAISLLFMGQAQKAGAELEAICRRHSDYLGARFMLAVTAGCQADLRTSTKYFFQLKEKTSDIAMMMAVRDLIKKLRQSHLDGFARQLELSWKHYSSNVGGES